VTAAGVGTVLAVVLAAVWGWAAVAKAVRHAETVDAFTALALPAPRLLAVSHQYQRILAAVREQDRCREADSGMLVSQRARGRQIAR